MKQFIIMYVKYKGRQEEEKKSKKENNNNNNTEEIYYISFHIKYEPSLTLLVYVSTEVEVQFQTGNMIDQQFDQR